MGNDSGAELPFCSARGRQRSARVAESDLHRAVRVQDSACHRQTPRGWDHSAHVMDVKDAAGNIPLLATLLRRVSDGLGRDCADLHMLAPDLILPLWFG